ncbi:hypothetical protein CRG98_040327 [Punica granatum]|uniref:Jacalin-type lectin domain-containing protein n=1 Tax=Punica granatum TaxID=22663 RepID=A0A2I0I5M5_PUNGR|nr:hypothetical protein CRG98_040327 [Punica granatum]
MASGLGPEESLQLFNRHAFSADHPGECYSELSKSVLHYAGGLPLALTTLGSFLHKKTKDQWHMVLKKLARYLYLDSVGVHLEPVSIAYPVKMAPMEIKLDYLNEFLASISGYMRQECNPVIVQSLTFHSNKRIYGL